MSADEIMMAIQEFMDNAFHPSLKPDVGTKAKALAIQALREKLERDTCTIRKYAESCEDCGFCRKREPKKSSDAESLEQLILNLDGSYYGKRCHFLNDDGTWYSREKCRDITFHEVIDQIIKWSWDAAQELEREKHPEGWVSVQERLPEDFDPVLLWVKNKTRKRTYHLAGYYADGIWSTYHGETATHWRPLPAPPKEAQDESQG